MSRMDELLDQAKDWHVNPPKEEWQLSVAQIEATLLLAKQVQNLRATIGKHGPRVESLTKAIEDKS